MTTTTTPEERLATDIGGFAEDMLGYCMYAFPWGETRECSVVPWMEDGKPRDGFEDYCRRYPNATHGPDLWACQLMDELSEAIRGRGFDYTATVKPVMAAVASGHGIGKSAFTGWFVSFVLDTRPYSRGIVTANTGDQLRTRTFAEICKWKKRAITRHWWEIREGGMFIRHKEATAEGEPWGVIGQTWRKDQAEAFAGQHAVTASSFYVFDEASAVHEEIWKTAMGGLTDGEPFFIAFGNPTRNSGRFFEIFHRQRHRWITHQVDSRTCYITNKTQIDEWAEDFGDDSDFFRVRVRGVFPRFGDMQFIPGSLVDEAIRRPPRAEADDPVVLGLDVARGGDDESVLCVRRGRDARTMEWKVYRERDTMQLVGYVAEHWKQLIKYNWEPDVIFVDGVGVGGGVVDRLRELGYPVQEVNAGGSADRKDRYYNKGAECWDRMKDWLAGGSIPNDGVLERQLTGREYSHTLKQQVALEKKEDMQDRGLESPDRADALALTFASYVERRIRPATQVEHEFRDGSYYGNLVMARQDARNQAKHEYDPFSRS